MIFLKAKENLITIAYNRIKNDIITNKMTANQRLSSILIAKELNMSRTPVREAFNILESEGYVEILNGVGTCVREVTNQEIADICEIRLSLEVLCLEKAFDLIPQSAIQSLLSEWNSLSITLAENEMIDYKVFSDLDYKTHLMMFDYCPNKHLNRILEKIYSQVTRIQYMSAKALSIPQQTIQEHTTLLELILDAKKEQAIEHLKKHIRNSVVYIESDKTYL